jgi:hypothetical protein
MKKAMEMMERAGVPGHDLHELPSSTKTFPDGAHWRVELSGMETPNILSAAIDECRKQGVPFHRSISLVRGMTWYTTDELREFAKIAADNKIEVIATPGPRPTWYPGRMIATPEGALSGLRMRGNDTVAHYIHDILRGLEIGFRGFLVWDEGVMWMLREMKKNGDIPKEVTFKTSVFAGHANAAGAKMLEELGANTFNPLGDLSISMLAAIRSVSSMPMDVHVQYWDAGGGFNRIYETPEFARVAAPCYFKMEPGPGLGMYSAWGMPEPAACELARLKARQIRNIKELIEETNPELVLSEWGPDDLCVPVVK